jgi:hypothetical protein
MVVGEVWVAYFLDKLKVSKGVNGKTFNKKLAQAECLLYFKSNLCFAKLRLVVDFLQYVREN